MEDKKRSWAVIIAATLMLGACATHDTVYDPDFSKGERLFDQIPNWEGEALTRCAGHIPPELRKPWQTGRC